MDSTQWERIQSLFHAAADLRPEEQTAFLHQACNGDNELIGEVLGLLDEDGRLNSLLDGDLAEVANGLLEGDQLHALPFEEVGPYKTVGVLGEGGMGVVYLARREDLGSLVAIKLLRDAWLSPARRERFASEQRTLAQLNHPSIARLYDADTLTDGTPYFVMEFVKGVPITEYCASQQCSIERRLQLFRQICEAVQYAHSQAVIHRDLKPSNILAKSDGTIRLLDFGIAKQIEALDVAADQTMTGLRLMTPAYAAPEQIRGERLGVQADVYSLGVILYELLAGKPPFDLANRSSSEAETILLHENPPKPSQVQTLHTHLGRSAWADLDVLCLTAMHKDPARRYQSAEAIIRDIDHYLGGEPLDARPDSLRYRARKFLARNRRPVAATAVVLLVVVGLITFFTVRLATARNAAVAEAARTQRIQTFMLNLFKGGDQAAGPSDQLKVVSLLDRGVREAQALNTDPAIQAELYQTLGSIYLKLGKFDHAESLMTSALNERKGLFGPEHRLVAETLIEIGSLREAQARYDEAENLIRQGLDITRKILPPSDPAVARAIFALGKLLEDRGKYDDATKQLEEAVRLQSAPGMPPADLAASLSELANCDFYLSRYDEATSLNERVLEMDRKLYGEHHPEIADKLINLGSIQYQLGNFPQSERYDRQALEIVQAWYGNDNPETADTMTIVSQPLTNMKRFDEATGLLQQSLAILQRFYGPVHPRVAFALNELGNIAVRQDKYEEAESYFKRVIDMYTAVYAGKHYQIGIGESNLAGVYLARKDYISAERFYRAALSMYAQTLPPDHYSVGVSRVRLGTALLGQHRYVEAEKESLAGYDILVKKTKPSVKWLQMARKDLVAEYEATHVPQEAKRFQTELEANAKYQP